MDQISVQPPQAEAPVTDAMRATMNVQMRVAQLSRLARSGHQ